MDIAASIKALAKSVHGDAVFGDLPRPRFSSQIWSVASSYTSYMFPKSDNSQDSALKDICSMF